ncbi:hypothetical protein V8F20_001408 [Naviculisporaceae sp. PSN 640]
MSGSYNYQQGSGGGQWGRGGGSDNPGQPSRDNSYLEESDPEAYSSFEELYSILQESSSSLQGLYPSRQPSYDRLNEPPNWGNSPGSQDATSMGFLTSQTSNTQNACPPECATAFTAELATINPTALASNTPFPQASYIPTPQSHPTRTPVNNPTTYHPQAQHSRSMTQTYDQQSQIPANNSQGHYQQTHHQQLEAPGPAYIPPAPRQQNQNPGYTATTSTTNSDTYLATGDKTTDFFSASSKMPGGETTGDPEDAEWKALASTPEQGSQQLREQDRRNNPRKTKYNDRRKPAREARARLSQKQIEEIQRVLEAQCEQCKKRPLAECKPANRKYKWHPGACGPCAHARTRCSHETGGGTQGGTTRPPPPGPPSKEGPYYWQGHGHGGGGSGPGGGGHQPGLGAPEQAPGW